MIHAPPETRPARLAAGEAGFLIALDRDDRIVVAADRECVTYWDVVAELQDQSRRAQTYRDDLRHTLKVVTAQPMRMTSPMGARHQA